MTSMVRKLRVENGMTQEELADRSGLSRLTIVLAERDGLAKAKAKTVVALADALGTDAGFLFASDVRQELQDEA